MENRVGFHIVQVLQKNGIRLFEVPNIHSNTLDWAVITRLTICMKDSSGKEVTRDIGSRIISDCFSLTGTMPFCNQIWMAEVRKWFPDLSKTILGEKNERNFLHLPKALSNDSFL